MYRKLTIAFMVALLVSVTAHAQTTNPSEKGYVLYSWKVKNHWYYSLLPRTNRVSYDEITAPEVVRRDSAGLRGELQKLPKGEVVTWMSEAPRGGAKSASGRGIYIKHPSRTRIKHIRSICNKLGIRLRLS